VSAVDPLAGIRTDAHPGPGPLSPASLRALELSIGRRVDGLLAGDHRSAYAGVGSELWQVRPYEPGDDVRRIEWNATARTGEAHVRVELAERVLVSWLVVDASASMEFGPQTAERRMWQRALRSQSAMPPPGEVIDSASSRSARSRSSRRPARAGSHSSRPYACCVSCRRGSRVVGGALELTDRLARQRALVVVVSDFRGPIDWRDPLLRLAARHTVLAVEIRDPREQELADVGELRLVDPRAAGSSASTRRIERCGSASPQRLPPSAAGSCAARDRGRPARRSLDRG